MRADTNPGTFLSKIYQLRDELRDLGEVVFTERLTTIVLDAFPVGKYSKFEVQAIRGPDLSLEGTVNMVKTIFINYSQRPSVPKRSQESYGKGCDSGREPIMSAYESEMSTVAITCQDKTIKKQGIKRNIVK